MSWLNKITWTRYWFIVASLTTAYGLVFATLYALLTPAVTQSWQDRLLRGVRLSISSMAGTSTAIPMTTRLEVTMAIQSLLWLGLFGLVVATLTTRFSRSRNRSTIAPIVAVTSSASRALLEFRLIVYPNPPLLRPGMFVTLNVANARGERENLPLELEPIQTPRVTYYLLFRAWFPDNYLRVASNLRDRLSPSTLDVYVTAIDDASEHDIVIHAEIELPRDAREGRFVDAVNLDRNGRIVGVEPEKFYRVEP